jgi:hypothetical protein
MIGSRITATKQCFERPFYGEASCAHRGRPENPFKAPLDAFFETDTAKAGEGEVPSQVCIPLEVEN